jgi:hypothetical protein
MVIRAQQRPAELTTASDVIDAVGGTGCAQKLTQKKTPQVVVNWRSTGRLPPDTFLVFQHELKSRGFTAPASLWGITDPAADRDAGMRS